MDTAIWTLIAVVYGTCPSIRTADKWVKCNAKVWRCDNSGSIDTFKVEFYQPGMSKEQGYIGDYATGSEAVKAAYDCVPGYPK